MNRYRIARLRAFNTLAILSLSLFVLWGCPKKAEVTAAPETPKETVAPPTTPAAEEAKPAEAPAAEKKEEVKEQASAAETAPKPIYFDFDKSFIRADAKAVMQANADWLKMNPQASIRIEGNCDERGTIEYNQALGMRRASSAKRYLTDLGIAASRITLISYGKEKPLCTEHGESCWQTNRRDDFVVESK